ncbi:HDOD domain-containing protein [Pseudoalteromonas fenneropenaei]|uniref:HDOD domain-containing protein n=1 Tax=Pseudoalteromonas fenneropenaei TaxID=1737459 RepID=A0ABV7CNH7_9GAMM
MTDDIRQARMAQALAQRAHDLLISHSFAQQQIGYIHTFDLNFGEDVPQRTLLEVEIAASAKRQQQNTSHLKYIAKASSHLHQVIENVINKKREDLDNLYQEVVGIQDTVPTILDILAVKSASVSRLEPLVNDLPWLGRDLVSLVNLPQYRKQRGTSTAVKVDTPALALRYLGLENLQLVIPTFAMRHWMPHATEPFPLLKRKLRDLSMSTAIAARELAELQGVHPQQAFTLGMLLDLGKIAATRLYLRTFEAVWQNKVQIARDNNKKDLHTALLGLQPDALYLRNLLMYDSMQLSKQLIEKMGFRYLPFSAVMEQFALHYLPNSEPLADPLPLTQVLKQAQGYAQYLVLKENNLIEPDEVKIWFDYLDIGPDALDKLAKCSYQTLQLTIN